MNSSLFGRVALAVTAALATATAQGAIPAHWSVWCVLALAFLQAFLHPVQQSSSDNQTAVDAIAKAKDAA